MPELNATMLALFSFPEAMVLAWLSLSLMGFRPEFRQILLIGFLQTLFFAFFFLVVTKMISLPFGVHTVMGMVVNAWLIQRVMAISHKNSWLAVVFGWTTYLSIECLMMPLIILVTGHVMPVVNESNWSTRIYYHYFELLVTLMVIFLIRHFNIRLLVSGSAQKGTLLLKLGGLLFVQSLLLIIMCYQYYAHHEHTGTIALSFVMGNAVLPMITLIIIAVYLWEYPKKYFRRNLK